MKKVDQHKLKDALEHALLLIYQEEPEPETFNWDEDPIICELNGYRWHLGPEADEEMNWEDAKVWCQSVGGELPPRDILLQCFMNDDIKPLFKTSWYWSSTEFYAASAWSQYFYNGYQDYDTKASNAYVRAVKKVKI